jgi:hypothetical protein
MVNDTWQLTLSGPPTWSEITPAGNPPSPRYGSAAIYDPSGSRTILFGGGTASGAISNETWELALSGTPTWTLLAPAGTPPVPRYDHAAIHDSRRRRMLVFAGSGTGSDYVLNDLWELTLDPPMTWNLLAPAGTPPARRFMCPAAYDFDLDRMIVVGGRAENQFGPPRDVNDTWSLGLAGGLPWDQLAPKGALPVVRDHAAIYDPVGVRVVTCGGAQGGLGYIPTSFANQLLFFTNPTAVQISLVSADVTAERIRLEWEASEAAAASVERRGVTTGWATVARLPAVETRIAYEDRDIDAGTRYGYRLRVERENRTSAEIWLEVPREPGLALEGFRPNPATRDLMASFALPSGGSARLELLDASGRLVLARTLEAGPGHHLVSLARRGAVAPGLYLLRLRHEGVARVARVVVSR